MRARIVVILSVLLVFLSFPSDASSLSAATTLPEGAFSTHPQQAHVKDALRSLSLVFIENLGQFGNAQASAQETDLDGDGIPDSEDPETVISMNLALEAGEHTFVNLVITGDSVLTLNSLASLEGFKGVTMRAQNLTVEPGCSISADGKGYGASSGPGGASSGGNAGAGYGGRGGEGSYCGCYYWGGAAGASYGSAIAPVELGSGSRETRGGGAIRLVVSGVLTNDGAISANGETGPAGCRGGGSGGSIYVTANHLAGSGLFSAQGGNEGGGCSGGGGGGRIAIYYQASAFTGTATTSGGTGSGQEGTVMLQSLSLEAPVSTSRLSESFSDESTLRDTVHSQTATLSNLVVQGDIRGVVDFTNYEMVTISTGAFSGGGFTKGDWAARLEGIPYEGRWTSSIYLDPSDRRFHLKGSVLGDMGGIAEGYLTESTPGSNVYDRCQMTWQLNRLGTALVSARIHLSGTVSYGDSVEYPSTELHILQAAIEGSTAGHYTGPLSTVLTHVRIASSGNPYLGEGFSRISYVSDCGAGDVWTYDRVGAAGTVDLSGLSTSPLAGAFRATLNETASPKTLLVTIERTDLGVAPHADVKVEAWGPDRVSPGQTVNHVVEYRNDGLKSAEDVTIVARLPNQVSFISSTGDGKYDAESHELVWHLGQIPARTHGYLAYTVSVKWGLPPGTTLGTFTSLPEQRTHIAVDPSADVSSDPGLTDEHRVEGTATVFNSTESHLVDGLLLSYEVAQSASEGIRHVIELGDGRYYSRFRFTDYLLEGGPLYDVELGARFTSAGIRVGLTIDRAMATAKSFQDQQAFLDWAVSKRHLTPEQHDVFSKDNEALFVSKLVLPECFGRVPVYGSLDSKLTRATLDALDFYSPFGRHYLEIAMAVATDGAVTNFDDVYCQYLAETTHSSTCERASIATARDPNAKIGPEGRVVPGEELSYRVEYENEGSGSAYGVYLTDVLDEDLDDSTLSIGAVFSTSDGAPIAPPGTYDPKTRTITWFVGEVPPGGAGYCNFNVRVRGNAPSGTEVINSATVYFPSVPEVTRTNGIVSIVGLNRSPVAAAGGPYAGSEDAAITFDASVSSDPDGDPLQYRWDFDNDGVGDTDWSPVPTAQHTWRDDYQGMIRLEVSDGQAIHEDSATVTVLNVAPTVEAGFDTTVDEGNTFSGLGLFSDPGAETWTARVDYGDSSGVMPLPLDPAKTFSLNHLYADSGVYTVNIAVTDDDNGKGSDTVVVTVRNVPPTPTIDGVPSISAEGTPIGLRGSATDPSPADTAAGFTYAGSVTKNGSPFASGSGATFSFTPDDNGTYVAAMSATDKDGGTGSARATVEVTNIPPTAVFANTSGTINEGQSATFAFSNQSDPSPLDARAGFKYSFDCTNDGAWEIPDAAAASWTCTYPDNSTFTVKGRIKDKDGGFTDYTARVTVDNVPPTVGPITAPMDPVQVNTPVNTSGNFTDPGVLDTHTAVWEWGDGRASAGSVHEANGVGSVAGSHVYATAGVYTAKLIVTDKDGGSGQSSFQYVVMYDPEGGFVTGGGWINSPAGAYAPDPILTGRANFGFVSKYKKGANVPTGNTEFQFKVANLNFHSEIYDWLVVAGAKAQYKGTGTINSAGNYGFMLTAIDGQINGGGGVDKFRIKIWDKQSGNIVYDNQMHAAEDADPTTDIGGGSIVIHK